MVEVNKSIPLFVAKSEGARLRGCGGVGLASYMQDSEMYLQSYSVNMLKIL